MRSLKVLAGIIVAQRRSQWPNIISQLGQGIVLSGYGSGLLGIKRRVPVWQAEQTPDNHLILFQCWDSFEVFWSILKQHWVNAMDVFADASVIDDLPALNQHWAAKLAQHWTVLCG